VKKQQFPSLFLHIGKFDLTFEEVSLETYLKNLQDEIHLSSNDLELMLQGPRHKSSANIKFTLRSRVRSRMGGSNLWALGKIYIDQSGKIRVVGELGLDYWFLVQSIFLTGGLMIFSLARGLPATTTAQFFGLAMIVSFFRYVVYLLSKGSLTGYLKKSSTLKIEEEEYPIPRQYW
jgi:hypothetical protein